MGKLKSWQEQVQDMVEKGINAAEDSQKKLAERPFHYAEKLEKEVREYSVKGLRKRYYGASGAVFDQLRTLNTHVGSFAADLVAKLERETREATGAVSKASNEAAKDVSKAADKSAKDVSSAAKSASKDVSSAAKSASKEVSSKAESTSKAVTGAKPVNKTKSNTSTSTSAKATGEKASSEKTASA